MYFSINGENHNSWMVYKRKSHLEMDDAWDYPHDYGNPHIMASDMVEGSLEVKLPTIWRDGKGEVGRVREEKSRSEKISEETG